MGQLCSCTRAQKAAAAGKEKKTISAQPISLPFGTVVSTTSARNEQGPFVQWDETPSYAMRSLTTTNTARKTGRGAVDREERAQSFKKEIGLNGGDFWSSSHHNNKNSSSHDESGVFLQTPSSTSSSSSSSSAVVRRQRSASMHFSTRRSSLAGRRSNSRPASASFLLHPTAPASSRGSGEPNAQSHPSNHINFEFTYDLPWGTVRAVEAPVTASLLTTTIWPFSDGLYDVSKSSLTSISDTCTGTHVLHEQQQQHNTKACNNGDRCDSKEYQKTFQNRDNISFAESGFDWTNAIEELRRKSFQFYGNKLNVMLRRTVDMLDVELSTDVMAAYVRARLMTTSASDDIKNCCDIELSERRRELLADILTCHGAERLDLFCDILRGYSTEIDDVLQLHKPNSDYCQLANVLETVDSLLTLVSPALEVELSSGDDIRKQDFVRCGCLSTVTGTDAIAYNESRDFDIEYVYYENENVANKLANILRESNAAADVVANKRRSFISCSSESTSYVDADGPQQAFVTSRGQPTLALSVRLFHYCLRHGCERLQLLMDILSSPATCVRDLSLIGCHLSEVNDDKNDVNEGVNIDGGTNDVNRNWMWLFDSLKNNSTLVKLDIRLSRLGNVGVVQLGAALRQNHHLQILNLASTGLTDVGCTHLARLGLTHNSTLVDLDLGFNEISDAGCRAMAEALLPGLVNGIVEGSGQDDSGGVARRCSRLRKLRIRDNGITWRGACDLFRSLARNSRLELVDISSNSIGDEAASRLSQSLLTNRSLREINLENCRLSAASCAGISRALRANTALRSLQISRNTIGDAGMTLLADGLKYNGALETLCANMCGVGNVGFARLLEALRCNATLMTVKLCYNNIGCTVRSVCDVINSDFTTQQQQQQQSWPSLEELYEKLRAVLHQNPRLRMLLWGNDLDSLPAFRAYADPDASTKAETRRL